MKGGRRVDIPKERGETMENCGKRTMGRGTMARTIGAPCFPRGVRCFLGIPRNVVGEGGNIWISSNSSLLAGLSRDRRISYILYYPSRNGSVYYILFRVVKEDIYHPIPTNIGGYILCPTIPLWIVCYIIFHPIMIGIGCYILYPTIPIGLVSRRYLDHTFRKMSTLFCKIGCTKF